MAYLLRETGIPVSFYLLYVKAAGMTVYIHCIFGIKFKQ
jgi:hypothetical protein